MHINGTDDRVHIMNNVFINALQTLVELQDWKKQLASILKQLPAEKNHGDFKAA